MRYSTPYRGVAGYRSREDDEGHSGHYLSTAAPAKTMIARYCGTCAETGAVISPGDTIAYDRSTRRSVLVAKADSGRYVSDVIRTSGGTFYRNKAGRCEDAPCCGCCTI
jgi:hypothetical protein